MSDTIEHTDSGGVPGEFIMSAKRLGELALSVCEGNADALQFCMSLSDIAVTLDHIVDGDCIDKQLAQRAFCTLILDWPNNKFIRDWAPPITCAMAGAISAWQSSDKIPAARIKAYDVISEVWSTVAFLLGGWERVNRVMPDVRIALAEQQALNDTIKSSVNRNEDI